MMHNDNFFINRRTVRQYTSEPLNDDALAALIEQASHAPTTGNMQLYSVIVTRSEEQRKALAPLHFGQPMIMNAAAVLTFCADFNRFTRWCTASGATPGYDNFQSFVTAMLDTALFAQQFVTAAEMNGLGCCYLGTTTYNAPQIAEVLGLPALVVPVTTVTVGHPARCGTDSGRLPVEAVMHCERYHDYDDASVRRLYAEKEAREDSRQFVRENGKESLAQVFTDVRYTRPDNEHFSRIYHQFILSQGFGLPSDK